MTAHRAEKTLNLRSSGPVPGEVIGQIEGLRLSLISDEPGVVEVAASSAVVVSVHVGSPVNADCRRAGERHRGRTIHGDIEIIPPRVAGAWEIREHDTALVMGLGWTLMHAAAEERGEDPARLEVRNRFQERDARIEHIAWALKAEMESGYPCGRLYTDGLAMALAATVVSNHSSFTKERALTGRHAHDCAKESLRRVLDFIEVHLDRDIGLAELALVSGTSVSQFTAGFRKALGVSPHQYVIRRRVDRAAALLRTGKLSIGQIALETGFCHQSHLARHMRRLLGASPQELRRCAH